jgi:phosphoglycerate dehydrogenase-like enzyme
LCRYNGSISYLPYHIEDAKRPFTAGTVSVGAEHLRAIKGLPGVSVVHSDGGNAGGVAELTLNLATTLVRQTFTAGRAMEQGLYKSPQGRLIEGKNWLLIGAGHQVAQVIAKATSLCLGGFTVYHDRMTLARLQNCLRLIPKELVRKEPDGTFTVKSSEFTDTIVRGTTDCQEAVSQADIISFHVPVSSDDVLTGRRGTKNMVNHEFLGWTKESCSIINVSRGGIVDEGAVVDWLTVGRDHALERGFASDVVNEHAERERNPALSKLHQASIRNALVFDPVKRLNLVVLDHRGGC